MMGIADKDGDGSREEKVEIISRREFMKKAGLVTGVTLMGASAVTGLEKALIGRSYPIWAADLRPDLVVAQNGSAKQLLYAALTPLGGMERFVKPGQRVVLKPNIGWARTPEQAGCTNPDLVAAVIKACYDAGAREVVLWDHTSDNYQFAFTLSKIKAAAYKNGAKIYSGHGENSYISVEIPRGKKLKKVKVLKDVYQAEVLINIPIAKQHYATELTLSLKNMMGAVWDMVDFHRVDLHQYIADLNTAVRPHLVILDAIRILTTRGPKGPGKVENPNMVIAGTDPVAIDAYATRLFKKPKAKAGSKKDVSKELPQAYAGEDLEFTDKPLRPNDVRYIKLAYEHGLGQIDLSKVNIKRVSGA